MEQLKLGRLIKKIAVIAGLLIVIWIGWAIYYSSTFHVVSLSPSSGNVSTITPYIKINFSKIINKDNLVISSGPSIIKSITVSGKTVTVNVLVPLKANKRYEITIVTVYDKDGKELKNVNFKFTPKYEPYNSLSKDQQETILRQQEQSANNQPPTFLGTSSLINNGLTTQQVQDFEQGVTNFAQSQKLNFSSAVVNQSTVTSDTNNGNGIFGINFTFSINSIDYSANIQYSGLQSVQLNIYNNQGTELYQYGNLNSASNTGSSTSN